MKIIESLRLTINSIFDLFLCQNFNKIQFFLGFTILSNVIAYLFSFIFYFSFFLLKNPDNTLKKLSSDLYTLPNILDIALTFLVLNFIVLLVYFNSKNDLFEIKKIKMKEMFNENFKSYLLLILTIYFAFTLYIILLSDIFVKKDDQNALGTLLKTDGFGIDNYFLNEWISNILAFSKFIFPYLFLILFNIYLNNNKKINISLIVFNKSKILSSLILILTIDKILNGILDGLNKNVFTLINIPFTSLIIPKVMSFGFYLCIVTFSYIVIFGAIYFPFLNEKSKRNKNIETDLNEDIELLDL